MGGQGFGRNKPKSRLLLCLFAENEFATAVAKQRIVIGAKEWDVMYMFEVKKNGANFSGILKK